MDMNKAEVQDVGHSMQLKAAKRLLHFLTSNFDLNTREFDADKLYQLKIIVKNNWEILEAFVQELMKYIERKNVDVRLAALLLIDEFFQRSHNFRIAMLDFARIKHFFAYACETDPMRVSLPFPKKESLLIKSECLRIITSWYEKFAKAYPNLHDIYFSLRVSKGFKKSEHNAILIAEQNKQAEIERRRMIKSKTVIDNLKNEYKEYREEILRTIQETRCAMDLLVPNFEQNINDFSTSHTREFTTNNALHAYTPNDSISIILTNAIPRIERNDGNSALIDSLVDSFKLLRSHAKLVSKWLGKLTKFGGTGTAALTCDIIEIKAKVNSELIRCAELKLDRFIKSKESDSESDEFEDVCDKEGIEYDFKLPDEIPKYILSHIERYNDGPSTSEIGNEFRATSISNVSSLIDGGMPNKSKHIHSDIPCLPYSVYLKYLPDRDIVPGEIPRNNDDCRRFWRPLDDSCEASRDIIDAYRLRMFTFIGTREEEMKQCRVPLKDGRLCPRKEFRKCAVHGLIIERDEMGCPLQPVVENASKSNHIEKVKEGYLDGVKRATGKNLRGNVKRKKPGKNDPNSVRERLAAKLFNRTTVNRVLRNLD